MQIIIRRDQKAFLNKQCKEIEENSRMRKTDLFKKIGDIKGTFHIRVGIIKDRMVRTCQKQKRLRRDINYLTYTDDTTLMAESEEELKSLLIGVKEESEKAGLKLNIKKTKIKASGSITSWQIGKSESSDRFYFLELPNHCRW